MLDEDNWRSVETFGSCEKDSDCSDPSEECISSTVPLLDGGTVSGRICTEKCLNGGACSWGVCNDASGEAICYEDCKIGDTCEVGGGPCLSPVTGRPICL